MTYLNRQEYSPGCGGPSVLGCSWACTGGCTRGSGPRRIWTGVTGRVAAVLGCCGAQLLRCWVQCPRPADLQHLNLKKQTFNLKSLHLTLEIIPFIESVSDLFLPGHIPCFAIESY